MTQKADSFELASLGLSPGEGKAVDLAIPLDPLTYGGQDYAPAGDGPALLDVSHTTTGYALRLRYTVELHGPCMRCLEDAGAFIDIDAREIDQDEDAPELRSPYVTAGEVDVHAWARDALALALPTQIVCRESCLGLCVECGENLNKKPDHKHAAEPDPRWAKLDELKFE